MKLKKTKPKDERPPVAAGGGGGGKPPGPLSMLDEMRLKQEKRRKTLGGD
jgi:hypothetical protein